MNAKKARRKRGFTLVELLFASSCSIIVAGGVLGLFITLSRLFNDGSTQMRLHSEARYGVERLAADVRGAELLSVPSSGDQINIAIPITNLRADIASSDTVIPVDSTNLLPSSGVIYIGGEAISYGSVTGRGLPNPTISSCTRAYNGTSSASHKNDEVVYTKPIYYLSGGKIYLNANGVPNTATDGVLIRNVEKIGGTNLFQQIPVGTSAYRTDRVRIAFRCFQDKDGDHLRDPNEPGVDFSTELFPRNK